MKEFELMVKRRLHAVYTAYLEQGMTEEVCAQAKDTYNEFISGYRLLSATTGTAVVRLFKVGYPGVYPDQKPPTREQVQEILQKLDE